ncbi:putative ribonuclease H-like domain-containing protein [Tanacetum coccineum]
MKKMYYLVVIDDLSRFSWVFFLATKDETSEILKTFITGIENLIDLRVKVIKCENETEFKNRFMNQFCKMKGIKRELSVARTPQQNGGVSYQALQQDHELFLGRKPALSFMRPFGCPVTIFNTIDHLGKFDGKADEGFFVGYSTNSKAFRVFNSRTRMVKENMHVKFSENASNVAGSGPNWIFDIDALTNSINYKLVVTGNQSNSNAGTKACDDAGKARMEIDSPDAGFKPSREEEKKDAEDPGNESGNPTEGKNSSDGSKLGGEKAQRGKLIKEGCSDFSEESIEKSWGKESAYKRGAEFILSFDGSFIEFVKPGVCFTRMVIAEPRVEATTRLAAYMGSPSIGL